MARLLPHLNHFIEIELSQAVEKSMDGDGAALADLMDFYENITDDDVVSMLDELRIGRCDGRAAAEHDDSDFFADSTGWR